jgi:hypothetical protein
MNHDLIASACLPLLQKIEKFFDPGTRVSLIARSLTSLQDDMVLSHDELPAILVTLGARLDDDIARSQFESLVTAKFNADNSSTVLTENLCKRDEKGAYIMPAINAAWWGWNARVGRFV